MLSSCLISLSNVPCTATQALQQTLQHLRQGNTDTAAVPASHDSKTRPGSNVQRPAPTIARSRNGAPGAVDLASYTCPQLLQPLANTDYLSIESQNLLLCSVSTVIQNDCQVMIICHNFY